MATTTALRDTGGALEQALEELLGLQRNLWVKKRQMGKGIKTGSAMEAAAATATVE